MGSQRSIGMSGGRVAYYLLSFCFLLMALSWVWGMRIPPMQDYPQHLMQMQLLETFTDPRFDWQKHFQAKLVLAPYSGEYWLSRVLTPFIGIEAAGKAIISLYFILLAVFVTMPVIETEGSSSPPWGMLLVYPLSVNQFYYFGFVSYLLSLPLLMLALQDLFRLGRAPLSMTGWLRHAALLMLLYLTHNYSAEVYVVLASAYIWVSRDEGKRGLMLLAPLAMASALAIWMGLNAGDITAGSGHMALQWYRPGNLFPFLALPFTGMNWYGNTDFFLVALWLTGVAALYRQREGLWIEQRSATLVDVWLLLSLLGYVLMPFWVGHYSYFNLRMAPVIYFLVAWRLSLKVLERRQTILLALIVCFLMLRMGALHDKVAADKEAILPVVQAMKPNSLVLPLIADAASSQLDRRYFYQMHAHDYFYYHVLKGGGANPVLFDNLIMPVRYRPDVKLPRFSLDDLSWLGQDLPYDYVVTRGMSPASREPLDAGLQRLVESGPWVLYSVRKKGKVSPDAD